MIGTIDHYIYLIASSAVFSLFLALYIQFTKNPKMNRTSVLYFTFILSGISLWSFAILLSIFSSDPNLIFFWEQFKYVGILIIPPAWMFLVLTWTGGTSLLRKRTFSLFFGLFLFFLFVVFSNPFHFLFYSEISYESVQGYLLANTTHGPLWWTLVLYAYGLVVTGLGLLLHNFMTLKKLYKIQTLVLLIGASIPLICNMIYAIGFTGPYFDYTPIGFFVTGIVVSISFTRFSLLEIVPIARNVVFENLHDPIFMFDAQDRLVEFNQAATPFLFSDPKDVLGKKIVEIFHEYPEIISQWKKSKHSFEFMCAKNDIVHYYDVIINPLTQGTRFLGNIFLFRDISERKHAEEQLKAIYTASPIAICLNHFENESFVDVNNSFIEISGFQKDEIIGKTPLDLGVWEEPSEWQFKRFTTLLKENGFVDNESFIFRDKTGKKIHGLISATTINLNNERYVLCNIIDATQQKKSEEIAKQQLTAITSSMDGIAILNEKGEYVFVNNAHAHIYGYDSPSELVGDTWRKLYNDEELKRFDNEIMPAFEKNRWWRGEAIGKKKDGMLFSQEVTLTGLDDGGLVCIVRDITKTKMVLKELEDAHQVLFTINKDLERKVKQRTEAIEQLIKQKDDFINQLGHDLKTPLTPLMILLPMIEKKISSEKDRELFTVVTRNVAFMKELVNKTINLAKLNSDKIPFNIEPLSLTEEIQNTITNNQLLFEENNIVVENHITDEIVVQADQIQLQELLNNLITNAVKYSSEDGGFIYIDVMADPEVEEVTVSIRDTGIGMDEEQISHVFNEFYKADDSRHNLDSSGLGLNISKRIVQKHKGKIWAESPGKNQGSTFYFTLKKAKSPPMRHADPAMESN